MEIHLLNLCLLLSTTMTILAQSGDDVNSLLTDIYITRGYNKKIRPLVNQNMSLLIDAEFNLKSVIEFDEKTESLKTSGYLELEWIDEYFRWDPATFNYIEEVFVPQDDIWKPDLALMNSFKSFTGLGSAYLNLRVSYDGYVTWLPYQVLESTCAITITYFPFDVQTCQLEFSAWSYGKTEVEIKKGHKGITLDQYEPNASWDILKSNAFEDTEEDAMVVFQMTLKRRPRYYIINIVIPIMFLSVLNVFSFVLPVASGERAGYSITVFLSLAVFLTIVSDLLPHNSEHTSFLAIYIMLVTGLSTVIVMLCMVQLRLHSWHDTQKPVNKFYRTFVSVRDCLQCRICSKYPITPAEEMASTTNGKDDNKERHTVTWLDVINAMDFIFFLASLIYTFVCTLAIGAVAVKVT